MREYFTVEKDGHVITCRICRHETVRNVILCGHGFAGSKDSGSVDQLASRVLKKCRDTAVVSFDWPSHGADEEKQQRPELNSAYLRAVIAYIRETYCPEELFGFGVSFGGYQFLRYIAENGSPFRKTAFRCPAVNMHDVLTETIMTKEQLEQCGNGRTVQAGFANKVPVDAEFIRRLQACDITKNDYRGYAGDMLIIHGTADEVVPFDVVKAFAQNNGIRFTAVPGSDHRFTKKEDMDLAVQQVIAFFGLAGEDA
ncbi:MAG: alpha/beta fold hydrolase [Solobacterium sp.]|nr:alpha/beta fold hydrolase [Solobacterium sp.]